MKRILIFLCACVCIMACSKIQPENAGSRDVAYDRALKALDVSLDKVEIWASKQEIGSRTTIRTYNSEIVSPAARTWLFFVDLHPITTNWAHPCQYVFVSNWGRVTIYDETMPPVTEVHEQMELVNCPNVNAE